MFAFIRKRINSMIIHLEGGGKTSLYARKLAKNVMSILECIRMEVALIPNLM